VVRRGRQVVETGKGINGKRHEIGVPRGEVMKPERLDCGVPKDEPLDIGGLEVCAVLNAMVHEKR
jgi:hypothetical protein